MTDPPVLFERRGPVAWHTLNRPHVHNAIELDTRDLHWSLLDVVEADPELRVAVFSGAGPSFSSGADLTDFGTSPSLVEARRARLERDLWGRLLAFDKPLVAAIHGYALGGGLELALCCDLRVAADDARLGLPEAGIGYIPSAGGTQTLSRLIGPGRALDLILTAEPVDASRALEYGLVHEVVPGSDLLSRAEAIANQLAVLDPAAVTLTKRALRRGVDLPLDDALRLEARLTALQRERS
jgi:enoyl-CoA hydratase/carnithine racemase